MYGILGKYDESIKLTFSYTYRMLTHLKNIKNNYENLKDSDEITLEVYRDSIIKKYETLEDLTWKLLSKLFKEEGLEINSPRGCYKQAFKCGLIEDMLVWNDILVARNTTSHIYNEDEYEDIKNNILNRYIYAIEDLLSKLSSEIL